MLGDYKGADKLDRCVDKNIARVKRNLDRMGPSDREFCGGLIDFYEKHGRLSHDQKFKLDYNARFVVTKRWKARRDKMVRRLKSEADRNKKDITHRLLRDENKKKMMNSTNDRGCVVYCIRGVGTGMVKIGTTNSIHRRLQDLQGSSPVNLEFIGSIPGSYEKEAQLHARFSDLRGHGEWFKESPDILSVFGVDPVPEWVSSENIIREIRFIMDSGFMADIWNPEIKKNSIM